MFLAKAQVHATLALAAAVAAMDDPNWQQALSEPPPAPRPRPQSRPGSLREESWQRQREQGLNPLDR